MDDGGAGDVRVLGETGPAVLLLPGGAESVEGFFPGLAEGLMADPGCRVVLHDRPGTVGSATEGSLADAASTLHATLAEAGVGPVVVVGQSLGGAVALLLALEHPEDVAGLVLLDATPVNDVALARMVEGNATTTATLARVPGVARLLRSLLRRSAERSIVRHRMGPQERAAMLQIVEVDLGRLASAAKGIAAIARRFDEGALPRVPAAVVSADRKPTSSIRRAHLRLAEALDAPLTTWAGSEHAVHLTHPREVLDVCRDVVRRVAAQES